MEISLRHLQQIEALARHRNFARAAQELNISQPGLSQSIRLLEEQLGFKLFDRDIRQVTPTSFGKRALELSRSILKDSEHLERELQMLANLESGVIRIGIGPLAAEVMLGRTLGKLAADYSKITIHTTVEWVPALLEGLDNDDFDILICDSRFIKNTEDYNITALPIYTGCYVCRTGHPLTRQEQVTFRDIFDYQIASPKLPQPIIDEFARLSGLDFSSMSEFPNGLIEAPYHLLTETIVRCDAVGLGISPVFSDGIESGVLHMLPLESATLTSQYELINLKRYTLSPAVQVFRKYAIATCHELFKEHEKHKSSSTSYL